MQETPRPIQLMNDLFRRFPQAPQMVPIFLNSRDTLPKWPSWCFLPMAAWTAIASPGMMPTDWTVFVDMAKLAAIGTWRYSQGIYRIDPDLLDALTATPVSGSLPSDVLYRLPEWSIYVDMTGVSSQSKWVNHKLYGFWAHLEWDVNAERSELRFLMDRDVGLIALPVHLGPWTVTEAIDRVVQESARNLETVGRDGGYSAALVERLASEINPLISILLYLCSDEPEIDDARQPGTSPSRPQMKKTKKGWRLFPPDKPRYWTVGAKIGEELRRAAEAAGDVAEPSGRTVRTPLRRGHWHGYWLGPRTGERKFSYRWLSPIVVHGGDRE